MVQSNAILRHIARKHGLNGSNEKEHCLIDVAIEGVESIRSKYVGLIYMTGVSAQLMTDAWQHTACLPDFPASF